MSLVSDHEQVGRGTVLRAVLDDDQETALDTYIKSGGVVLSVHSGSACLYEDSSYNQTIGGGFCLA